MKKQPLIFTLGIVLFISCKNEKTPFEDVFVVFEYTGNKIDTTTATADQLIFRNVDGSPPVFIPAQAESVCENPVRIGNYPINDTLEWHLRLVDPDGDPANFKIWFDQNHTLHLLNDALHFIKPSEYNFAVRSEVCNEQTIIVIGN